MEKSYPKQFFIKLVILAGISIIIVVLSYLIGSTNAFAAIVTALFLMATAFFLLFYWVYVLGDLLKHLFDKEKKKFDFLYLTNTLFISIVLVFFLLFYFELLGGAFLELLF